MTDGTGGGDDDVGDFFRPPPFRPAEALSQLQRTLRALPGLSERGSAFEWKGRPVLGVKAEGDAIAARLTRRPTTTPEWETRTLKNGADVRRFADDVKQRLARWRDADE
ncbi:MAG: hypothetical protein KA151_04570 [Piscinibacter sp.]|nr:hypothetical protein [Piscinibacter sp.]